MIKYKYLYDKYLEEIDSKRKQLGQELEIKVNNNIREITFLTEDLAKANKAYVIVALIYALLLYPFYTFMVEYLYIWTIFIYFGIAAFTFLIIFFVKVYFKAKIKSLNEENASDKVELKEEYTKLQEEIYKIALFIIVSNENYDTLCQYSGQKQQEIYKDLLESRKDIINISMNYQPNVEKYQRYLDEWIKRREVLEEDKI